MSDERDQHVSRDEVARPLFAVYADPATVLHLSGELDVAGASTLASALDPLTVRGGVIGLDLADLTFMDSTGIKALCQAMQRVGDGGRIVLFRPRPFVLRVLEIAGLDGTYDVSDEIHPLPI